MWKGVLLFRLKNENLMKWWVVKLFLNFLLCYEPSCCFPQMMYDLSVYCIVGIPYVKWILWSKLMVEDDLPKIISFRMP